MTALVVALTVAVGLLAVLVAGLLRSHADILKKLHDLGAGDDPQTAPVELRTRPGVATPRAETTPAHDIVGVNPAGNAIKVGITNSSSTTLLAFLTSGCLTCRDFWEAFANPDLELPGAATRLVIVTKGLDNESESMLRKLSPAGVMTVASNDAWTDYNVPVSPYFILVDGPSGGTLGEGAAGTWKQVSSLLAQAVADAGLTGSSRVGGLSGADRHQRADDELAAAGIEPGHPSLYPPAATEEDDTP